VLVKIANHTECKCQEHSLIRRHVREKYRKNGSVPECNIFEFKLAGYFL